MNSIRNTILVVGAVAALTRLAQANSDSEFARSLPASIAGGNVEAAPTIEEPRPTQMLYAIPILQGSLNESISVFAMNETGDRAIIKRISPNSLLLSGSTKINLLTRSREGWMESNLLSRRNGHWPGGLAPFALSRDGRYLIFTCLENIQDYDTSVIKVLDINNDKQILLAKGRGRIGDGIILPEDIKEAIMESEWFRKVSDGRTYEGMFPNPHRRCSGPDGVELGNTKSGELVVEKSGLKPFAYPLKKLPGTRAWAYQGAYENESVMSKDCSVGLTTVQELLDSQSPSFFYGTPYAYDGNTRLMEYGVR